MYKLEYLSAAKNDMLEIIKYITYELKNPQAALRLADKFVEEAEKICIFPYANTVYLPLRSLKLEYRKITVGNYFMFYTVDEEAKLVTVMRVIYAKRDMNNAFDV